MKKQITCSEVASSEMNWNSALEEIIDTASEFQVRDIDNDYTGPIAEELKSKVDQILTLMVEMDELHRDNWYESHPGQLKGEVLD